MTWTRLVRAELRKLTSTRMPIAFLAVLIVIAAINAFFRSGPRPCAMWTFTRGIVVSLIVAGRASVGGDRHVAKHRVAGGGRGSGRERFAEGIHAKIRCESGCDTPCRKGKGPGCAQLLRNRGFAGCVHDFGSIHIRSEDTTKGSVGLR